MNKKLTPISQADAYKVAHLVEKELGWDVGGWKIAATNKQMQGLSERIRRYMGVFTRNLSRKSPVEISFDNLCSQYQNPSIKFSRKRFATTIEPYELSEVANSIKSMHPGLELAECRFIHDNKFPPLEAILSDGAGSGTLVYGPAIPNWEDKDIANNEVNLFCNGVLKEKGNALTAVEHPLVPVTWLANELSKTGIGLKKGQVISTGTLTGMLILKKEKLILRILEYLERCQELTNKTLI